MMIKIAALIMFKNEETNLGNCLISLKGSIDFILGYDDHSQDKSKEVFQTHGGEVVGREFNYSFSRGEEREIRTLLMEEARKRGATHFLFIDSDEFFSDTLKINFRLHCEKLFAGQKLLISWVNLAGEGTSKFSDDSPFATQLKDFVVRDHENLTYFDGVWSLHFGRTPLFKSIDVSSVTIPHYDGVILHSQHLDRNSYELKQAKYKCIELIHGSSSAFLINDNTRFTLVNSTNLADLESSETHSVSTFSENSVSNEILYAEIAALFQKYGVKHFEKLEIWHLESLNNYFVTESGRKPRRYRFHKLCRKVLLKLRKIYRWLVLKP